MRKDRIITLIVIILSGIFFIGGIIARIFNDYFLRDMMFITSFSITCIYVFMKTLMSD